MISKPNSTNPPKQYNCLIDTGASKTFISNKVISDLKLDSSSSGIMSTVSGNQKTNLYLIHLSIEGHKSSINLEGATFNSRPECDVILGMDIIIYGLLILDKSEFSFDIDSLK